MSEQSTTTRNIERLLLTAKEAAQALGIGRSKVYELIMSGELESVRIGGSRRIPVEALRDFVDELRSEGSSAHNTRIHSRGERVGQRAMRFS